MKLYVRIGLLLFLLGSAVLAGYYILSGYPEYAVLQINKSVDRHNWRSFSNFVEVDSILGYSFDAFATIQFKKDSISHCRSGKLC